jgi:hypothetical protein
MKEKNICKFSIFLALHFNLPYAYTRRGLSNAGYIAKDKQEQSGVGKIKCDTTQQAPQTVQLKEIAHM